MATTANNPMTGGLAQYMGGAPGIGGTSLAEQTGAMGVGGMSPNQYFGKISTGGYGLMPASASPLSQAMQGDVSAGRWRNMAGGGMRDPGLDYGEMLANSANIGYQNQQQEFQRQQQQQAINAGAMRNQALQKLLALITSGKGGGAAATGPVAVDPKILAAIQAKVQNEFERPGGLQSQLQRLGASQNRYTADSTMGAARQASLDRARAGAMTEAYLPAYQSTVAGWGPALRQQEIGQTNELNQLNALMRLAG